jgi:hypothetical protein
MKHSEKVAEWRAGKSDTNLERPKYFECFTCFISQGTWKGTVFVCENGHESDLKYA